MESFLSAPNAELLQDMTGIDRLCHRMGINYAAMNAYERTKSELRCQSGVYADAH